MSDPTFTQKARCPGCGLWMMRNDETLTIAHEAPECAWFREVMAEMKGKRTDGVTVVDVKTGETVAADPRCAVCTTPYSEHAPERPHDNPARGCRAFTYGESVH